MATKLEKMKAAMYACGVDEAIVQQAVENVASKEPPKPSKHSKALAKFAPSEADIVIAFEERFWPEYPKRIGPEGKSEARTRFVSLVKSGAGVEKIIDAARELAADWAPRLSRKPDDARFIPMAVTWLNKKRWKDEPSNQAAETMSMMDIARDLQNRTQGTEQ